MLLVILSIIWSFYDTQAIPDRRTIMVLDFPAFIYNSLVRAVLGLFSNFSLLSFVRISEPH
jgi:hypothetical protein